MQNMPDPYVAKETIWLPFLTSTLQCDADTILIGHSSGAEAAMRYLENNKLAACFLVSPCVTDLGSDNERASGYYSRPWLWQQIRANCGHLVVVGSRDDHLIPYDDEICEVVKQAKPDKFMSYEDYGHFLEPNFPELVKEVVAVHKKLKEDEAEELEQQQQQQKQ